MWLWDTPYAYVCMRAEIDSLGRDRVKRCVGISRAHSRAPVDSLTHWLLTGLPLTSKSEPSKPCLWYLRYRSYKCRTIMTTHGWVWDARFQMRHCPEGQGGRDGGDGACVTSPDTRQRRKRKRRKRNAPKRDYHPNDKFANHRRFGDSWRVLVIFNFAKMVIKYVAQTATKWTEMYQYFTYPIKKRIN